MITIDLVLEYLVQTPSRSLRSCVMAIRKVSQHAHARMPEFVRSVSDDSLFFWTFVVFETTPEKLLPTCKCRMQQLNKLPVQGTSSRNHLRIPDVRSRVAYRARLFRIWKTTTQGRVADINTHTANRPDLHIHTERHTRTHNTQTGTRAEYALASGTHT